MPLVSSAIALGWSPAGSNGLASTNRLPPSSFGRVSTSGRAAGWLVLLCGMLIPFDPLDLICFCSLSRGRGPIRPVIWRVGAGWRRREPVPGPFGGAGRHHAGQVAAFCGRCKVGRLLSKVSRRFVLAGMPCRAPLRVAKGCVRITPEGSRKWIVTLREFTADAREYGRAGLSCECRMVQSPPWQSFQPDRNLYGRTRRSADLTSADLRICFWGRRGMK